MPVRAVVVWACRAGDEGIDPGPGDGSKLG